MHKGVYVAAMVCRYELEVVIQEQKQGCNHCEPYLLTRYKKSWRFRFKR
jgi:hypothetical protein